MIAPPKPPPNDELEALIREARERQGRRRLLAAAGVAIAVAVGLGIYALTTSGGTPATTGSPGRPGGVPPCRSSQLAAQMEWAYPLTPGGWVVLTNTSDGSCSLPSGVPRAWITWGGKPMRTREVHRLGIHPSQWRPLRPAHVLPHGRQAFLTFAWLNSCSHSYRRDMRGHLGFGRAVVSFDVGAHPPYQSCGSPSILEVSQPLLVPR